jgi:C-terminal processing protease CtpA/Prc
MYPIKEGQMKVLRPYHFLYPVLFVIMGLLLSRPGQLMGDETKVKVLSSKDHGWVGVSIQEISEEIREAKDLGDDQGVLVNEVFEESPAEKAGLETGDVITKFRGTEIEGISHFVGLVQESKPGEKVALELVRDGKRKNLEVEIGERPYEKHHIKLYGKGKHPEFEHREIWPHSSFSVPFFGGGYIGVKIHDLNDQLADALGLKVDDGAFVIEAEEDGPAYEAGIRGGDVIVKVDDEEIADPDELRSVIGEKEEGDEVEVTVYRNKKEKSFKVTVAESPRLSSIRKHIETLDFDEDLLELEDLQIDIRSEIEEEMAELKEELEALKEQLKEMKEEKE